MRFLWLASVVTLASGMSADAQSLAEAARKAKERREAAEKEAPVITTEELRSGRPADQSESPGGEDEEEAAERPARASDRPSGASGMTETDRRRAAARSELQAKFRQMVSQGNALIEAAQVYLSGNCVRGAGEVVVECDTLERQISGLACAVGTTLDEVERIARRGSLPPGIVREAREETGLDGEVWRNIQTLSRQHCVRGR